MAESLRARPPMIVKLDKTVVDRIAAGEVVVRPAAAIKEMLENSLDAGATAITITAKGGGLQLLQIQDNGCGIRKEDLGIVCERFTTSKLRTFDDLKSISTFGFRGEALASITHVAHVTITTKTEDSQCAYKAKYLDGVLVPFKVGESAEPKMCAGMTGTTISVEDLFYNMQTRKQAFKNVNEQYQRILDVVTKYSMHYGERKIAFTCKRHGSNVPDLHTSSNASTLENIKTVYGAQVSRELLDIEVTHINAQLKQASKAEFSIRGKVSNANHSSKKGTYIMFINDRLVECQSIKKVIEAVYADVLPKHTHPFVYLAIQMPPQHIDVNVHPTKKEVHFMYEDEILEALHAFLHARLRNANESRTFYTQALISTDVAGNWASAASPANVEPPTAADSIDVEDLYMQEGSREAQSYDDDDNESQLSFADSESLETRHAKSERRTSSTRAGASSSSSGALSGSNGSLSEGRGKENNESRSKGASSSSSVSTSAKQPSKAPAYAPNKMVRTDPSQRRIDAVFYSVAPSSSTDGPAVSGGKKRSRDGTGEVLEGEGGGYGKEEGDGEGKGEDVEPLIFCGVCGPDGVNAATQDQDQSRGGRVDEAGCQCCGSGKTQPRSKRAAVGSTQLLARSSSQSGPRQGWKNFAETSCEYASVQAMLDDIKNMRNLVAERSIKQHSFVGLVDCQFAAVQFNTKLLLLDFCKLSRHLFYQLTVRQFGSMPHFSLQEPVSILQFARAALDAPEAGWTRQDGDKDELAAIISGILVDKAEMLHEYFRIGIDLEGNLVSMPDLLGSSSVDYLPGPEALPMFFVRLASDTDWTDEQQCFTNIAQHLAALYCAPVQADGQVYVPGKAPDAVTSNLITGTLLPAIQHFLLLPNACTFDGTIKEVASLEKLYRIFERC